MNKREFYRELMSEYSFDKQKILENARKGKRAGRRSFPVYIGMTAAAAAVVVAVGTAVITMGGGKDGVSYVGGNLAALSDSERIDKAKNELIENENSDAVYDMMVSFNGALSSDEVQSLLTVYSEGSVPVKALFFSDGSRVVGSEQVGAVFENGGSDIIGAVISCPGYLMKTLMADGRVLLVEIASDEDLDTLIPIVSDGSVLPPDTLDSDNSFTNPDNIIGGNGNETVVPPESPSVKLPEGVNLPDGHEAGFSYVTDDLGADCAYFLNENVFYVKTADSVRLYRFDGESEALAAYQDISGAQVCWISENGGRLMVTGEENGVRRKMFMIDANSCTISDMCVEDMVEGGSIAEAAYNETDNVLALNVYDNNSYRLSLAGLNGYQASGAVSVYSEGQNVNLLGEYSGTVYFSESGSVTEIYKSSGDGVSAVAEIDGNYSFAVNLAFTHAVMTGSLNTAIFDPVSESVITADMGRSVSFGIAAHTFACGGDYYRIENGAIFKTDKSVSVLGKIDFERGLSSKYAAVAGNGAVQIISSDYGVSGVSFEQPAENASAELRSSLGTGVGVINAIASGKCAECGINTADILLDTLSVCFTKSAKESLIVRCGILGMDYVSGGLSVIDLTESVLVISENNGSAAEGTLYVKVGTFDGNIGYRTYPVKFAKEDGVFRLDCVIG